MMGGGHLPGESSWAMSQRRSTKGNYAQAVKHSLCQSRNRLIEK